VSGAAPGVWRRDLIWSGIGTLVPALAALWAVPRYTAALGAGGFGLLAMVWALVGWFSVADLGLSRAITHGVAKALATGDTRAAGAVVWSALALIFPLSLVVGGVVAGGAPWAAGWLQASEALASDTVRSLRWVGVAIPLTVLVTAFRGVGEGARAFPALGAVRAPIGVAFALFPLWLLGTEPRVSTAVQGIVVVRGAAVVVHAILAAAVLPTLRVPRLVDPVARRALLSYGGWTTVVQSVGPLLNMVDRFLLGVLAPVAVLGPYGVASEAGTRIWLLASVIVPVLFTGYAATLATSPADAVGAYLRGLRLLVVTAFPVLLGAVLVGDPVMRWWVGEPLGATAAPLLAVMAVGLMANQAAQGSQAFVQAAGQPVLTAVGYLWQLPVTVMALLLVVPRAGATGAAWVWAGRFVVDALWSAWAAERAVPLARQVRGEAFRLLLLPPLILAAAYLVRRVIAG